MTIAKQSIILAILAAFGITGWFWITDGPGVRPTEAAKTSTKAPPLVYTHEVISRPDQVNYAVIGTGEAKQSATLFPNGEGDVTDIMFAPGTHVSKGTALLRLSDTHERLNVQLADVAAKEADRVYKRISALAKSGAVSSVRVQEARVELENARLKLAQARAVLRDRTVFAPFDGVVGMTDIGIGDRVEDDSQIAILDDHSVIDVHFVVPEEFAGAVAVGSSVTLTPADRNAPPLPATVTALDSRIDAKTRSLSAKASIANPDGRLRPGTSFIVEMTFTGGAFPTIPEVAVLWSKAGAYVWRVVGDVAKKTAVSVVRRSDGQVLVDGELQTGERIVVEGVQGLRDGQAVEAKPITQ